jgi:hypothetical protein
MIQRASVVGELAARLIAREGRGEVTRVFQRSTYIRTGEDYFLLHWGDLKSPMAVNMVYEDGEGPLPEPGEGCSLGGWRVGFESWTVDANEAEVHRSGLTRRRRMTLPEERDVVKGIAMLKSLYDAYPSGPTLPSDESLKSFALETLVPFAEGSGVRVYEPMRYLPIIGRGGGFTPAGDDFVGGFLATFNCFARCTRVQQISIPLRLLAGRTVPESAALLSYASRGYMDEPFERLILGVLRGRAFFDDLLEVAHRGHTSGIDASLGVILAVAALSDRSEGGDSLRECLRVMWNHKGERFIPSRTAMK